MIEFDDNVHTIFIMTGFACNYNCKYCMQHGSREIYVPKKEYNLEIIDFIKQIANKRKESDKSKLILNFFGGEPLLFLDIIKDIIERVIEDYVDFSIITNGSLITDEFVSYVHSVRERNHYFGVSVSWDGRNTKHSRLRDVFEDNKENIFKLRNFSISGVINKYNYPRQFFEDVQKIEDEYKLLYPEDTDFSINFSLDTLYNLNNPKQTDVFDIDFDRLRKEIEELIYDCYHNTGKNNNYHNQYISEIINRAEWFQEYDKEKNNKQFSCCMNGIQVINLDLDGNLYMCHDDKNTVLGTIHSSEKDYYTKYRKHNCVLPQYFIDNCNTCDVRFVCNGGCMLLSKEERDNYYCKQRKAMYEPVIEFLMRVANNEEFTEDEINKES